MANISIEGNRFAQLEEAKGWDPRHCPKSQRVPRHLRNRGQFAKCYYPRLVSFGPIHHGKPHLRQGQQYKLTWASMYVETTNTTAEDLHKKIAREIQELRGLYSEDATRKLSDKDLAWVLFVDGCSLLQILNYPDIFQSEALKIKVDQMALVRQDSFLLENQLPYQLLKLLSNDDDDARLMHCMKKFLKCHHLAQVKPKVSTGEPNLPQPPESVGIDVQPAEKQLPPPLHLLDLLRRTVLLENAGETKESSWTTCRKHNLRQPQDSLRTDVQPDPEEKQPRPLLHLLDLLRRILLLKNAGETEESSWTTYRNIQELKSAVIRVKRINSNCPIDICFSPCLLCGVLKLPEIVVDDTTAQTYLNLIAYERCPGFQNKYEISSFVEFLDSLIDHHDDVKELRQAGVLRNGLGSNEEVANLFNTISADLVPDATIYASVRAQIEEHYKKKHKTWVAQACHTYFSTPWALIAFLAAFLALVFTSAQTWFAIFPSK